MIVCVDEVGFSFLAPLGRTWAPKRKPPELRRVTAQRRELSTIVGLSLSGRIHKQHLSKALDAGDVVMFLLHLLRWHQQRLIVIWDHASIHTAKLVEDFLAANADIIEVEWLPLYAPDLNPEEACHGNVKVHLRNFTPDGVRAFRHGIDREFARLRRHPDLLYAFFLHAGLFVKRLW